MKVLGLIIARGNNLGVPGKHLRDLEGQPVIAHVINYSLNEPEIDMVALSSDGPEIIEIDEPFDLKFCELLVKGNLK